MRKSNKKGFTVVELVIVIAIIAILAAVLIPTFAGLIQKANESKDTQLVKNLNTALAADNKEHKTMTSALEAAAAFGYDVGKINASATGNEILWDSENDVFCYLKGENVEYIPETNLKNGAVAANETYKLWKIYTSEAKVTEDVNAGKFYSIYWNSSDAYTKDLKTGFDAGECKADMTLKYVGNGTAQNVVIRTNGGTVLSVEGYVNESDNTKGDIVNHYGEAGSVDVIKCATASYHEYGKVGFIKVTNGRLSVESTGKVVTVFAAANTAKIDNNSGTIENAYAASGVNNTGNVTLNNLPDGKTVEDIKQEAENKHSAVAIVDGAYQTSLEAAFTKAFEYENPVIDIIKDIDLSATKWCVDMKSATKVKTLVINGNNHTINGLSVSVAATNDPNGEIGAGASNYYGVGFISRVDYSQTLTINDLTFNNANIDDKGMNISLSHHTSGVAVVVGISYGKSTLNNVNVLNSSVYGGEKIGALIGYSDNISDEIINCSVENTSISTFQAFAAYAIGFCSKVPSITNLKLVNNNVSFDSNSPYIDFDAVANDSNDGTMYGKWLSQWYRISVSVAYRPAYSSGTIDGVTTSIYGSDVHYTKNGDTYSVN